MLMNADVVYLLSLSQSNPALFLDEYCCRLYDQRFMGASLSTIHLAFKRAGINTKRVQKIAKECCPIKRSQFVHRIAVYPPQYLVSVDEMSKDDRTYMHLFGRAPKGKRVEVEGNFVRGRRFSLLAGMALDVGILAARVVEGSFNHELFYKFLRDDLVCTIDTYLKPD
jgi:hypothetical protein